MSCQRRRLPPPLHRVIRLPPARMARARQLLRAARRATTARPTTPIFPISTHRAGQAIATTATTNRRSPQVPLPRLVRAVGPRRLQPALVRRLRVPRLPVPRVRARRPAHHRPHRPASPCPGKTPRRPPSLRVSPRPRQRRYRRRLWLLRPVTRRPPGMTHRPLSRWFMRRHVRLRLTPLLPRRQQLHRKLLRRLRLRQRLRPTRRAPRCPPLLSKPATPPVPCSSISPGMPWP